MSEDEVTEPRVPKIKIEVNGTPWDFQAFCQHMFEYFQFLATRPGYRVAQESQMEGMEVATRLMETATVLRGEKQFGPTLLYSNVRNAWVACDSHDSFEIKYISVGADPLLTNQINLASI